MFCKQGFLYYWAWLKCISVPRVCVRACVQSCCTSRHRSIEVSAPQTDFKDISTPCVQQQTLQHSCHPPTFQHVTVRIKGLQRSWHAHYCQVMYLCTLMSGRKKEQGVLWYCKLYICLISLLEQVYPQSRIIERQIALRLVRTLHAPTVLKGPLTTNCSFFFFFSSWLYLAKSSGLGSPVVRKNKQWKTEHFTVIRIQVIRLSFTSLYTERFRAELLAWQNQ